MKSQFLAVLLFSTTFLEGAAPSLINYQGLLTDINGNVVSGSKTVSISIHDAATDGTQLYSESIGSVTVQNGIYSFQFGSGANFSTALATGSQHWLQVIIDGIAQTPRERLVSVPFAMEARTVTDGAITAEKIATSAVTSTHLATGAAAANLSQSGSSPVPSGALVMSEEDNNINLQSAGYVRFGTFLTGEVWDQRASSNLNSGRQDTTTIWTGTELIIWGGYRSTAVVDGLRYKPSTNTWSQISTVGAPTNPIGNNGVWTGSELIIWGGNSSASCGRYNPTTDSWTPMSIVNAPTSRQSAMVVWTGTEMLIWGGYDSFNLTRLNSGSRYNPVTDSWTAISSVGAPSARSAAAVVWTGQEMLIWGGSGPSNLNTGGKYNPTTNTWTAINTTGAPSARQELTAIWTGSEMLIWGAWDYTTTFNNGGRYNPTTNSWTAIATSGAPSARREHSIVWTGEEMIIWGGWNGTTTFNDGSRYNPVTDSWKVITTQSSPSARRRASTAWTGKEMFVWSGSVLGEWDTEIFAYRPYRQLYLYQRP